MTTRSKNSIDKLGRCSTTGQVARRCRCIHHDEWVKDNPDFNLINLVKDKSKNLSKSIEKKIREKNSLSGKFICTRCIRVAKDLYGSNVTTICKQHEKISSSEESDNNENMNSTNIVEINQEVQRLAMKILQLNKINKAKVNLKPIADALPLGVVSDMLIYKIEKNKEENDENINIECIQFINYLGGILSGKVYEDAKNIRFLYQDGGYLLQMKNLDFINDRNVLLVQFLLGLTGIDLKAASDKEQYAFACVIESIYHLRNLNVVLPNSFLYNLVQFYTSGSKTVPAINGKVTPGGSYYTVHNWLSKRAENPLICPEGKSGYSESILHHEITRTLVGETIG